VAGVTGVDGIFEMSPWELFGRDFSNGEVTFKIDPVLSPPPTLPGVLLMLLRSLSIPDITESDYKKKSGN
jgi:hypothetical protein